MHGALLELAEAHESIDGFQAGVLELLTRTLGADAAFFAVKAAEPMFTARGVDAESLSRMLHHGDSYERELSPVKRAALAARGVAVDTAVLGESGVRRTRYFRDVVSRVKGRHSLLACVSWRGTPRGTLMLGRNGVSFSSAEIQRVEALLPELCAARATYGWPVLEPPLPEPSRGWLARLQTERLLAVVTTEHGQICVRDRGAFREMVARDGERELVWTRAARERPSRSGWPYIELFHVAAAVAAEPRRALFIGLGGGVSLRQFARQYRGIAIDVVERDPQIVKLARDWFDVAAIPGVTLHAADGVDFVRDTRRPRWDVMIVDTYGAGFVEAFGSRPFFAAARRALTRGGALALNLIGTLDGGGELASVLCAARGELEDPRVLPVLDTRHGYDPRALRNLVLVWSKPRA